MNGSYHPKKSYALSLNRSTTALLEYLLIIGAGALAMFLHAKLRIPLNLPGHHGLEFMAIYVLIRLSSNVKYAATLATAGTALTLLFPGMGAGFALNSISYLLPGLVLDAVYLLTLGRSQLFLITTITAGIAYMSIPLSRLVLHGITGYPYMAMIKFGALYTVMSFLLFGLLGGMLGYGLNAVRSAFRD